MYWSPGADWPPGWFAEKLRKSLLHCVGFFSQCLNTTCYNKMKGAVAGAEGRGSFHFSESVSSSTEPGAGSGDDCVSSFLTIAGRLYSHEGYQHTQLLIVNVILLLGWHMSSVEGHLKSPVKDAYFKRQYPPRFSQLWPNRLTSFKWCLATRLRRVGGFLPQFCQEGRCISYGIRGKDSVNLCDDSCGSAHLEVKVVSCWVGGVMGSVIGWQIDHKAEAVGDEGGHTGTGLKGA